MPGFAVFDLPDGRFLKMMNISGKSRSGNTYPSSLAISRNLLRFQEN